MAIKFQRAPTVSPGDEITWIQYWQLARAFNDRLRANLGDDTWRVFFYVFSLFRQIRNSDGVFSFPSMAEFLEFYQNLDPEDAQWPPSAAGDPEGVNVSNPLGAFVFGNGNFASEAERYSDIPNGDPQTFAEAWELAKRQRGGIDPDSGALSAPVFSAARAHFPLLQTKLSSPHNTSYGGFAPGPRQIGDCGDGTSDDFPTPNLEIFFTNLDTDEVRTFPGTCPDNPDHVAGISHVPSIGFYVRLNSGADVFFSDRSWITGPYSGSAALTKQQSDFLPRVLNKFAAEYRGSDAQRPGNGYNLDHAFDFQKFHESYYRLAPQYGRQAGDFVYEEYPLFVVSPTATPWYVAKGTQAKYQGRAQYRFHEGFVCPGFRVTATDLRTVATLAVMDGETTVQQITVSPGDDHAVWLDEGHVFESLRVVLVSSAQFGGSTGKISIEFLETLAYRPGANDLFILLRLGGASDQRLIDGRGIDEDQAKEIGEVYFDYGCMAAGFLPLAVDEINTNGVFDAARRFSRMVRCIPRDNLIGYAVENGRSVCWFKRYARGMEKGTPIDMFWDIAPGRLAVESGAIMPGRKYIVTSGFVVYARGDYPAGKVFTGVYGETEFKGGTVKEFEGIRHVTGPGDVTNQWLMGCQFKVGSKFESNPFKYEAYTDYTPLSDRCTFYAPIDDTAHLDLSRQFSYGKKTWLWTENPTGYRYLHGINGNRYATADERLKFWKSCRVHEPDAEIDSATVSIEGGIEVVKLVFTSRFQHCAEAPGSIARDLSAWVDDPNAESYRTMENGLRCFLLRSQQGKRIIPMIGDTALGSELWGLYSTLDGAGFPHFLFTQLIPEPYIQADGDPYDAGTPLMHDPFARMGVILRAMCEGYVDGKTSENFGCACFDDPNKQCALYNYTWSNLCHDAFGDKWMHSIPLADDNKEGYWPLPNTDAMASQFNEFSAALNRLTRANVWLPFAFQVRTTTYQGNQAVTAAQGTTCTGTGSASDFYEGETPNPLSNPDVGDWQDVGSASANIGAYISNGICSSGMWNLHVDRQVTEWRYSPLTEDVQNAIPEAWRDMLLTNIGTLVKIERTKTITTKRKTPNLAEGSGCCFDYQKPCPGFYGTLDGQYWIFGGSATTQKECKMMAAGTITPEPLGAQIYTIGRTASLAPCFEGAGNSIYVTPLDTESVYIEVPLTD